jgi:hypothetical protein
LRIAKGIIGPNDAGKPVEERRGRGVHSGKFKGFAGG